MFFKKKPEKKKQGSLDKVVTGVILGAAIGSVLGVGFAPKKGQETRKDITKKANRFWTGVKEKFSKKKGNVPAANSKPMISQKKVVPKTTRVFPNEN